MITRPFFFRYAIVGVKSKRGKDENIDKFGIDVYTKFNDKVKRWIKDVEKIEVKEKKVEDSKCSLALLAEESLKANKTN